MRAGRQDGAGEGVDGPDKVQVQVWVGGTGVPETPLVINIRPGSGPDKVDGVTKTLLRSLVCPRLHAPISRAMKRSQYPRAWRLNVPGTSREAP